MSPSGVPDTDGSGPSLPENRPANETELSQNGRLTDRGSADQSGRLTTNGNGHLANGSPEARPQSPWVDVACLEHLFEQHAQSMYLHARSIVGNPEVAEDIIQDVFATTVREVRKDREISRAKVKSWLHTCVHHAALSILRDRKKRSFIPFDPETEPMQVNQPETAEKMRQVFFEMLSLSERQYTAVLLRDVMGMDYTEVAKEMATSTESVRQLLFRARRSLRSKVGPEVVGLAVPVLRTNTGLSDPSRGHLLSLSDRISMVTARYYSWIASLSERWQQLAVPAVAVLALGGAVVAGVVGGQGTNADASTSSNSLLLAAAKDGPADGSTQSGDSSAGLVGSGSDVSRSPFGNPDEVSDPSDDGLSPERSLLALPASTDEDEPSLPSGTVSSNDGRFWDDWQWPTGDDQSYRDRAIEWWEGSDAKKRVDNTRERNDEAREGSLIYEDRQAALHSDEPSDTYKRFKVPPRRDSSEGGGNSDRGGSRDSGSKDSGSRIDTGNDTDSDVSDGLDVGSEPDAPTDDSEQSQTPESSPQTDGGRVGKGSRGGSVHDGGRVGGRKGR